MVPHSKPLPQSDQRTGAMGVAVGDGRTVGDAGAAEVASVVADPDAWSDVVGSVDEHAPVSSVRASSAARGARMTQRYWDYAGSRWRIAGGHRSEARLPAGAAMPRHRYWSPRDR
jgi:hypothetical protein